MDPSAPLPWSFADIRSRLASHWQLKFLGVPAFIAVFFLGYFCVLRFPVFAVTHMPVTALDHAVSYEPAALVIYLSLWVYVSLVPALLRTRAELFVHGRVAGVMGLVGLGIFFFWPSAIPMGAGLDPADAAALAWLKQVDAAGNACPSLHVAFAVHAALWLHRLVGEMRLPFIIKGLNVTWCAAIMYSTLATKQHVMIDVVAGGLLGLLAGTFGSRLPVNDAAPEPRSA